MNNSGNYHIVVNPWGWNIEQRGLYYTDMGNMVGLQCNWTEDDPHYEKIRKLCDTILKCITEIEEINEGNIDSTRIQRTLEGLRTKNEFQREANPALEKESAEGKRDEEYPPF